MAVLNCDGFFKLFIYSVRESSNDANMHSRKCETMVTFSIHVVKSNHLLNIFPQFLISYCIRDLTSQQVNYILF